MTAACPEGWFCQGDGDDGCAHPLHPADTDPEAPLSVSPAVVGVPESTESAEPALPRVSGPFNCMTDDPHLNVAHLIVANLAPGQGLAICGYTMNVGDAPALHADQGGRDGDGVCHCEPFPKCEGCVAAKEAADERRARMSA